MEAPMLPSPNSTVTIVDDKARAEEEFEMADANRSARLHMTSWTPNESEHLGTPGTPSRPGAPIGPYWKREARAVREPQPPPEVPGVTPRAWKQMSVAQQSSLHALGLTPRGWSQRMEAGARDKPWSELSEKQREAAIVLGWDESSWSLRWGNPQPPDPVQWVKPKPPPPAKVSAVEAIKGRTDFKTLGVFSQPSYISIDDPFRTGAEAVERRKIMPLSGICHEALMSRARGKGFSMKSPRAGKMRDAYFGATHGGHHHTDDPDLQRRREIKEHASFVCTDRSHGTFGMTKSQYAGEAPIFAPTNPAKSLRTHAKW